MAQTEDTELRDLVIEALEKNGSLAKIRALLRANIFLAFEDESENIKQNAVLSDVLQLPEGVLSLSIIHEFLEFCNLKNTLFVYMSESRQGKEYSYEGRKLLTEKLNFIEQDNPKEPFLITLVKKILKSSQKKYLNRGDTSNANKLDRNCDNNYKDDQNCTYIVHDDTSSATSNSHSDNSSDEKNKLHLKLQLDNSDTDTSSDSTRDRTSSEYIPNEHVSINTEMETIGKNNIHDQMANNIIQAQNIPESGYGNDFKINNNSSDSTSYVELKPLKTIDQTLLTDTNNEKNDNHMRMGNKSEVSKFKTDFHDQLSNVSEAEPINSVSLSNSSSVSLKSENENKKTTISNTHSPQESVKSVSEVVDYSFDFSSSPVSINKKQKLTEDSVADDNSKTNTKSSPAESPHHNNSHSSHSSVSISDVADLIEYSERNSPYSQRNINETKLSHDNSLLSSPNRSKASFKRNRPLNEDSGEFSDSPVPSLSNLSLDIHSE